MLRLEQFLKSQRGLTLVELMIVVLIAGILAMVGLPSYRGYMQRAQRTEAKDALVRLANNQERFYLQNNTYSADVAALGFNGGFSDEGNYVIAVTAADRQGFTATATPAAGSGMAADTECSSFTIDSTGDKGAAPDPNNKCW